MTGKITHWMERFFVSAFVLDDDGTGLLTPKKMKATGDEKLDIESSIDHATTSNATPLQVPLLTLAEADVVELDLVVTCKTATASKRAAFKLSVLASKLSGTVSFDDGDGTDANPKRNDDNIDAALVIDGSQVLLELTGLAATNLSWGWELRKQRQL